MVEVVSWGPGDVRRVLRVPTAADHKYSRGVVGLCTGSERYPGAAVLGVEAAWRTGVGMVRYTGPARDLVLARRPETVAADGRVQAWVVGSGMDAALGDDRRDRVRTILGQGVPVVLDAGALGFAREATGPVLLTPHDREHAQLRAELLPGDVAPADRAEAAQATAATLGVTVLLKGASTFVAPPAGPVLRVDAPTSWLATAGTGDVLAGVVGALVAGAAAVDEIRDAASLAPLAASAAWLHGRAAAMAADALGRAGGPITAMDVAGALPRAVAELLASD